MIGMSTNIRYYTDYYTHYLYNMNTICCDWEWTNSRHTTSVGTSNNSSTVVTGMTGAGRLDVYAGAGPGLGCYMIM